MIGTAIKGLLAGSLLAAAVFFATGCSTGVRVEWENDVFYPAKHEARKDMPWYGSVSGDSNKNGFGGMKGGE